MHDEWQRKWREENKDALHLRNIYREAGNIPGPKLHNSVSKRRHLTMIAQLRTGHCPINKVLYRMEKRNNPACECNRAHETIHHYLLKCELFERQTDKLRRKVGAQGMRVEKILGNPKMIGSTIQYIKNTDRFYLTTTPETVIGTNCRTDIENYRIVDQRG